MQNVWLLVTADVAIYTSGYSEPLPHAASIPMNLTDLDTQIPTVEAVQNGAYEGLSKWNGIT